MSLLRRGDRFPSDGAWTEDAQFPLPDTSGEDAGAAWRRRWSQRAPGKLLALAMTRDGQCIVAGSRSGWVMCYDYTGRMMWRVQVEGAVHRIALAEEGRCVLVGTAEQGHAAHLFHFDGRRLRTFEAESEAWGIDLLPDASLVAVGGLNGRMTLYNREGAVVAVRDVGSPIRHTVFLPGGDGVLVSGDSGVIYALDRDGSDLWQYRTEGRIWAGVRIAVEADLVFAGSNDHRVYALNRQGRSLWSYDTGGLVNAVAVTPDGRYCAAVGSANSAFLFDAGGHVVWQHTLEQPLYGLTLSVDGRFMALSADDNTLYVVDHADGHAVWSTNANGRAYALALTLDGRSLATAVTSQGMHLFDNSAARDGAHESGYGTVQHLLGRAIVKRVRDDYARDCHAGLVRWFTEFQRSLRGRQYGVCQALLDEIGDVRSYHLNEGEQQVIRSLEGVRWLFEGVDYHRQGQVEAARTCYERSKTIQASVNNKDGVGQVIAALAALPAPAAEMVAAVGQTGTGARAEVHETVAVEADEVDVSPGVDVDVETDDFDETDTLADDAALDEDRGPVERLLDDIVRRPRILGTSEKLLEQRLIGAPPTEQLRIVVLARQAGYLLPLLRGLEAEERLVRAAASAALTFLQPGPGDDVLARMLQSPQSFVRWNAARMMLDRAENRPEQFEASKAQLWPLALNPDTFDSLDALARREVALLVESMGTGEDTAWLIARLADPDADVQLAAVDALAKVGGREALAALGSHPDSKGFMGRDVASAARDAIAAIETRYPLPSISRIYVCSSDPLANRRVSESTLFLSNANAVYCVVDLDHAQVGARVRVRWLHGDTTLHEEDRTLADELPPVASVQEIASDDSPSPSFARPGTPPRFGASTPARDTGERPGLRPFGARSTDQQPERPSFLRREPAAPSSRPGVPRADAPSPGAQPAAPRPGGVFGTLRPGAQPAAPRPGGSPVASRPGAQPAAAPRPSGEGGLSRFIPLRGAEPTSHPVPARPSPFQRTADPGDRPARPGFPASRRRLPSLFDDDDDRPAPPRSPFGRFPGGSTPDPLENIDPDQDNAERPPDSPRGGERVAPPVAPRPGGAPTSNPFARPAPARAGSGDLPDWLLTDEEEDDGPFGSRPIGRRFGSSPGQPASPFGSRYGDVQNDSESSDDDQAETRLGGIRRSARMGTITRLAFALPRPAEGWPGASCQFEIELVGSGVPTARSSFRFVDVPQIARLEPGFMPAGRGATFAGARRFLITAKQIACQVHLTDAPVNTRVWGRCYDVQTGTLMGETSACTRVEGNPSVLLQWPNNDWPAAAYRIEVSAEGRRAEADAAPQVVQRQTTIDLIEHILVARVSVCHRVDEQNGPVGCGWPFQPGDLPWCVVEFDDPPPEITVNATWYSRDEVLYKAKPVTPITEKGRRAAFHLQLAQDQTLEPGFYSVVIDGEHVPRQEQVFEVQQRDWWTRIRPRVMAVRDTLVELSKKYYPLQFLAVLGGVLLFALTLVGCDAVLREVMPASERRHDGILRLGHVAGAGGGWWALAWVIAGSAYSALYVRVRRQLGDEREQGFFTVLNLLLVLAGGGLLWYELSYIVFAPAKEPGALGSMFRAAQWLAPVLAWCGVPMGVLLAYWYLQEGNTRPFTIAGLSAAIMVLALAVSGYPALLVTGALAGIVGAIPEGLLTLAGVDNRVSHAFMVAGASGGFVLAGLVYAQQPIRDFWHEWHDAKSSADDSGPNSLLDYVLKCADVARESWWKFGFVPALVALGLAVAAGVGMAIAFDPVVVPVLKALYDPANGEAFERVLNDSPAIPVAALALWIVAPVIVVGLYRAVLDLNGAEKRWLRRIGAAAILAGICVPAMIALISRTELVSDLGPESLIFWANRMAALLVGLVFAGWLASMIWHKPGEVRLDADRSASLATWTVLALAMVGLVFWPFWMWALAVGAALSVVVTGTLICWCIR